MARSKGKLKILYVGSSWMTAVTLSSASSFAYDLRGAAVENTAEPILAAWRGNPHYEVTYLTSWDALAKFPQTPQALRRYSVVILNDTDSDSLVLYPGDRLLRTPMGSNRLKSIREYVRCGGALLMVGGYFSFTGRHNAGNFHRTPVEEALPVNCLAADDDRVEAPEGVTVEVKQPGHAIMQGIRWRPSPMFTGYNLVQAKEGAEVLATFKGTVDPAIVVWSYESGRSMAITTGIAPHWGSSFSQWKYAMRFLEQALAWLTRRSRAENC
ncbi:MAG: glutamine amidotransferase [Acidobacteriota bacterium]|jgi:uncharacterized membrane protein